MKNNLTKTEIPQSLLKIMVHIWKFLWSFGLSWFSSYVFISNYGLNGYVYILEIVLGIDKLIHASRNICGCLTLNEIHIKLTSLIIFSSNDSPINASSTPPPEGEKAVFSLYSTFNNFVYHNRKLHLLEI